MGPRIMIAVMNASLIDEGGSSEEARLALDDQYSTKPQTFEFQCRLAAKKAPADDDRIQRGFA
jgi:hypothetical protein